MESPAVKYLAVGHVPLIGCTRKSPWLGTGQVVHTLAAELAITCVFFLGLPWQCGPLVIQFHIVHTLHTLHVGALWHVDIHILQNGVGVVWRYDTHMAWS